MALGSTGSTRAHVGASSDPAGRPVADHYSTPPQATRALLHAERKAGHPIPGPVWEPACGSGAISEVLIAAGYQVTSTDLYDRVVIVEDAADGKVVGAFSSMADAEAGIEERIARQRALEPEARPRLRVEFRVTEIPYDYGTPGVDFLAAPPAPGCRSIVTNPPFGDAEQFAERAAWFIGHTEGTCALMQRLAWLETPARAKLFERTGLSQVWVLSRRIPLMHRPGYTGPRASSSLPFAWFVWMSGHSGPPTIGWVDWQDAATTREQPTLFPLDTPDPSDSTEEPNR